MKKFKIAVMLLLCAAFAFGAAACADEPDEAPAPEAAETGEAPAIDDPADDNGGEEAPAEPERLTPDLPDDVDFEDYDFRIMFRSDVENIVLFVRDIMHTEEAAGEVINDAVLRRNAFVEETLNVNIVGIPSQMDGVGEANAGTVRTAVRAGDDRWDAVVLRMGEAAQLMQTGEIIDFGEIPYIDLDRPWWNQALISQLSIGPHRFAVAGDIVASWSNAFRILFFNKNMVNDLALESPYQMVRDNTWTLDNFYSMIQGVSQDLDGDGEMGLNDRFGFLVQGGATASLFYGAGQVLTGRDANNVPIQQVPGETALIVLNLLHDILSTPGAVMFDQDFAGMHPLGPEYILMETFQDNRGLFFGEILQLAERLRAADIYFGILPPPKANEHQANYMAFSDNWCLNLLVVPATNTDLRRTGIVLEALAAESRYTVRPAFYDIALTSQFARDDESAEMLDIIIANPVISLDEVFGWNMHSGIQDDLFHRRGDFASVIEARTAAQEANITRIMGLILDR